MNHKKIMIIMTMDDYYNDYDYYDDYDDYDDY